MHQDLTEANNTIALPAPALGGSLRSIGNPRAWRRGGRKAAGAEASRTAHHQGNQGEL